jgi:ubiquitin C-terminal hydrolase
MSEYVEDINSSENEKGTVGLPNVGNSCYFNSTIQCLIGTRDLVNYFSQTAQLPNGKVIHKYQIDAMATKSHKNNKTETKRKLIGAWYNLMGQLWMEHSKLKVANPIQFYNLIGQVAKESRTSISIKGDQNDFQEFLILLLDSLHDGLSRETTMNIVGKDLNRLDKLARVAYENFIKHFEKDYSIIIQLFSGQINTSTIGKCGHQSNIFDPIKFFPLIVPTSTHQIKLEELFANYISKSDLTQIKLSNGEVNDERWFCDKCKTKVDAHTCNTIWELPQYLIISLGRYQYFPRLARINTPIIFPLENLDMTPYFSGFKKSSMKYDLYAVSNHYGNPSGGHYTAFRKNPNGKWYHYNDSSVSLVTDLSQIITMGAYCLFYQRHDS